MWAGWLGTAMVIDYKFVYPARQSFLNVQSCKHENPAMDLMIATNKKQIAISEQMDKLALDMEAVKRKLDIG
jgi:hypothetical protein